MLGLAQLLQATSPRPQLSRLLGACIGIAIVWSYFGHIDVVASAQGKIIPRGHVKIIQAADVGVVRAIHVVEGQFVKAGEPLIALDPTSTNADAMQARESMYVAEVDSGRFQKFRPRPGADPRTLIGKPIYSAWK